jgi:hypothetical protein
MSQRNVLLDAIAPHYAAILGEAGCGTEHSAHDKETA